MASTTTSFIVFACLLGAAFIGMRIRSILPQQHLSSETKDSVRLGMGSVATMAALVLGLLVASAKSSYDTARSEVIQMCAKIVYLDNVLTNYGPETAPARAALRQSLEFSIHRIWPTQPAPTASPSTPTSALSPTTAGWNHSLPLLIQNLDPQNDNQRTCKSQATQTAADIGQMRWLIIEQNSSSISPILLTIMICWLAITFASVGLFAPTNATSIFAQAMAALAVSGAIFLILELDQPLSGIIQISAQPAQNALRLISQ